MKLPMPIPPSSNTSSPLLSPTTQSACFSTAITGTIGTAGKHNPLPVSEDKHRHNNCSLEDLSFGDHICGIYDTLEELENIVCSFVLPGLRNHERVICALDTETEGRVIRYLKDFRPRTSKSTATAAAETNNANNQERISTEGNSPKNSRPTFDINELMLSKQLVFLHHNDTYLNTGEFNADDMCDLFCDCVAQAKMDGWHGVRSFGEMSWIVRSGTCPEKVFRYENMINDLCAKSKVLSMCGYDRNLFEPAVLLNIMSTHPVVSIGADIHENFYYIPFDHLAKNIDEQPGATLKYWIKNLTEKRRSDRQMLKAREEAEAESKRKSLLLSTIFHDLRCPLIGIIGSIEMLRHFRQLQKEQEHNTEEGNDVAKSLEREFEDSFKTMQVCSDHLLQVVNGILDFSRATTTDLDPTEFSLHTCLDDTLRVVENRALEKDIGISVDLDDATGSHSDSVYRKSLPDFANSEGDPSPRSIARVVLSQTEPRKMIFTDEGALRKILVNVVGNAVKFTNRCGNIRVSVSARPFRPSEMTSVPPSILLLLEQKLVSSRAHAPTSPSSPMTKSCLPTNQPKPSRLLFEIKDDGIGISPKDLSRIFEAFQRVDDARDSSGHIIDGTGLGLCIVRTLANMMGGDVAVESAGVGHGSVFSVWIPAYLVTYNDVACPLRDAVASIRLDDSVTFSSDSTASTTTLTPTTPQQPCKSYFTHPYRNPALERTASIGAFPSQEAPDIRTLKYLVCDDNKINFLIMTKFLNSFGCQDVSVCSDGQSAVDLVRQTIECADEEYGEDSGDDIENETDVASSVPAVVNMKSDGPDLVPAIESVLHDDLDGESEYGKMGVGGERNEKNPTNPEDEEGKPPPQRNRILHCPPSNLSCITTIPPASSSSLTSTHSLSSSSSTYCDRTKPKRRGRTRHKPFDVIFVDYRMPPGINGAETSKRIRALIRDSQNPPSPASHITSISSPFTPTPAPIRAISIHQPVIVFLTAAVLDDESADCLANGIHETLLKPLKRDFLEKRLWEYARWLEIGGTTMERGRQDV